MTKLYISNFNIYNSVKYSLQEAKKQANTASLITYKVPTGFAYEKYIKELPEKFKNTNAVLGTIEERVILIDKKINTLVKEEINRVNLLADASITENNKISF